MSRGGLFPILLVYVEQQLDGRFLDAVRPGPWTTQHSTKSTTDDGGASWPDARHGSEAPVVRGHFERLERVHVQRIVYAAGQLWPHSGNGPKDLLGIERAPQAFELAPTACPQHLGNRCADCPAHVGQSLQRLASSALEEFAEIFFTTRDCVRGLPVGAHPEPIRLLLLEQVGDFA
jgi:hypothetical protein